MKQIIKEILIRKNYYTIGVSKYGNQILIEKVIFMEINKIYCMDALERVLKQIKPLFSNIKLYGDKNG